MEMQYYDHVLLFAALVGVAANVIQIADRLWALKTTHGQANAQKGRVKKMKTVITIIAILATLASIVALTYATGGAFKNEQLTREAWRALDAKNIKLTIEKAEECVTLFHDAAIEEQNSLLKNGVSIPPKGKATQKEKEAIFGRGLLNDVATCWFILGKAHTENGNKEKAEKAFSKVLLFPYARCYDPSHDSFWAPSEGATVELKKLSGKSIYD